MKPYAVILCGGRGERFWPKSRRRQPKQFMRLFGDKSLTQQTSERVKPLCPSERQLFVTPAEFAATVRRQLRPKPENLLLEPEGRNTAPAIGVAAAYLAATHPGVTMVVLPADHLIKQRLRFLSSVRLAARLAQEGMLVCFGIPPARPDTGYGYIHVGRKVGGRGRLTAHKVVGFREKPDPDTARSYVRSGNYLWNSGMFVWRVDVILEAFERFMPEFRAALGEFTSAVGTRRQNSALKKVYEQAPSISIDYAVMEKAHNIIAVRATFDWDDVGSWLALARQKRPDKSGNVVNGLCVSRDVQNCIVDSDTGVVAVLGVEDLVVVRSKDAVLVARRDKLGEIKELLKQMAKNPDARGFL